MEFTQIQTGSQITRYYIDGLRVSKSRYEQLEQNTKVKGFYCFLTQKIGDNKYRHKKISYGI